MGGRCLHPRSWCAGCSVIGCTVVLGLLAGTQAQIGSSFGHVLNRNATQLRNGCLNTSNKKHLFEDDVDLIALRGPRSWTHDFPPGFDRYCITNTGGTCKYFGCDDSRGPTDCKDDMCYCQEGHCAINGACVKSCKTDGCDTGECQDREGECGPECGKDTGGTCAYFGCDESRNSICVDGKCVCRNKYCTSGGVCVGKILPKTPLDFDVCVKDTGGTCANFGCDESRGPTECVDAKCVCKWGYCAVHGTCVASCKTDPVGTCEVLSCNADRGPTDCQDGSCLCQEGTCPDRLLEHCAHPCEKDTLGTCRFLACSSWHGPTNCVEGKCLCMDNQCSQAGKCVPLPDAPQLPEFPEEFTHACVKFTTGTCQLMGCSTSRGMTECIDGKCVCAYGYCAVNGECVDTCETETTGTCANLPCNSDRGPVDCVDGKCVCQEGTCADHSKYACAHPCEEDTQGTCAFLACDSSRGPTHCHEGKCLCQDGYCSEGGKCVRMVSMVEETPPDPPGIPEIFSGSCMKNTGGTCDYMPCKDSRGPTDCIDGKCLCKYGLCSVNGECVDKCKQHTTGTCANLPCNTDRGSVDCVHDKCVCEEGACADRSKYACSPPCATKTGGTCNLFPCSDWRGATDCVDGHCHCQEDFCAVGAFGHRVCTWKYSGMREPPDASLKQLSNKQQLSKKLPAASLPEATRGVQHFLESPPVVVAALAGLAAALLTTLIAVQFSRRRISMSAREPLLANEDRSAC